jgi:hypothetical protein
MGLFGLGIVTLALFIGLFSVEAEYQYTWLIRGYLVMTLYAFGFRVDHITRTIDTLIEAINGTL